MFRRTLDGFDLSDVGQPAINEIRKSIEHVQRGFDRANYTATQNRGPFRIGHSLYTHGNVLLFLQRQKPPGADFSRVVLQPDTTVQLISKVLRGKLHVGFGAMPIVDEDLWVAPIAHECFSVCISDTHPLKDRVRISISDLVNETLYCLPRSSHPAFHGQITKYLKGLGVHSHNLREAGAIIQAVSMAANQLGVALVPQSAAQFQYPGVLFKPLTDKLVRIETAFFVRRDQMHGAIRQFANAVLAELRPPKTNLQ